MARERTPAAQKDAPAKPARTRSAASPAPSAPAKPARTRSAAPAKDAPAKPARTRSGGAAAEKPAAKGSSKREAAAPRRKLNLPGRVRRNPVDSSDDAVKVLIQAALNANPDLEHLSSGQLNLMLMGAGLATSSAEACVVWQKAVKAGAVVEV